MLKQEEVLYASEFQIQCLERKVARASGDRCDFEAKDMEAKISELEKELEEKKTEEAMVNTQIKKAEEDGRAAKRKKDELQQRLTQFEGKNSELMLASETSLHAVKGLSKEKEEKMLARDLLQMEVNRLQEIFNLKSDAVFGMEDTKARLKMSIDERKNEIEARFERQRLELKSVQEELHKVTMKKKRLYLYCEKLQAKYEILLKRIKVEVDQERSPQYYLDKAAQDKELIQQQGYQLEQQAQQVQQDIKALEAAMDDIKDANEILRNSHKSAKSMELADEQARLKEELDQALETLRTKQKQEQSLLDDVAEAQARLENIQKERSSVTSALTDLEEKVEAADKEAEEQARKNKRAQGQLEKLTNELKGSSGDEAEKIIKKMHLIELKESAKEALYRIKVMVNENPEYAKVIEERLNEAGLKMPSGVPSMRSSRSSKSSMSSHDAMSTRSSSFKGVASSTGSINSWRSASSTPYRSGSVVNMEFCGAD